MKAVILVFIFGGLGSISRYGLMFLNQHGPVFKLGTFAANLAACLIAGLAAGYFTARQDISIEWRFAVVTGFCGGFSTMSSVSMETVSMMRSQKPEIGLIYSGVSISACIVISFLGIWIAKKLFGE